MKKLNIFYGLIIFIICIVIITIQFELKNSNNKNHLIKKKIKNMTSNLRIHSNRNIR